MPETGGVFAKAADLLSFSEIERFARVAAGLGIDKVRLTGGEPLMRPKLPELVAKLSRIAGIRDLALTTNGVLLADAAEPLREAGLRGVNIHIDTLDRERFRQITRRDDLRRVLAGFEAAKRAGFEVIKINAVAIKGLSEPDIISLVRFGRENGVEVRFVEFMPLDAQDLWSLDRVLTLDEMVMMLEREFGPMTAVADADPRAPASEYQFSDGYRVGFIPSVSKPFCMNCNRLRLTSDGKIRYCLFAIEETDVRPWLKREEQAEELEATIRATVWKKWVGHEISRTSFVAPQRPMYAIGG